MAQVLRQACDLPAARPALPLVDTCGTGGDGADSFNISTAVAFVAAACGAHVAKHGNRSASGRVGSADVLEAAGIHLQAPQAQVIGALAQAGLTFLFAPGWHPALVGLAPLRRSLGVRTVFNLLGPLVNPLRPDAQVLGVARADLLDPMADALARLGLQRAVVVYGQGDWMRPPWPASTSCGWWRQARCAASNSIPSSWACSGPPGGLGWG